MARVGVCASGASRRVGALTLALLAFAEPALAQRAWRTPGEADGDAARRLASQGRCGDALASFDSAILARAEDASLRRDRGLCHERLGHPAPAIEDYRAYLSMQPTAVDAGPIRTRLDALEADEEGGEPSPASASTAPDVPAGSARDGVSATPRRPRGLPDPGDFLIGLQIGERGWKKTTGYAVPTVGYGLGAGFAYAPALEVDARLLLLRTNFEHTGGFGAAIDNAFKLGLDGARRWELALLLGAGLERQSSTGGVGRMFYFGHVNPKLRFLVAGSVALEVAPEFGFGLMDQETEVGAPTDTAFTLFYGGYVQLAWLIRSGADPE